MNPLKRLAGQTAVYGIPTILGRFLQYLLVVLTDKDLFKGGIRDDQRLLFLCFFPDGHPDLRHGNSLFQVQPNGRAERPCLQHGPDIIAHFYIPVSFFYEYLFGYTGWLDAIPFPS